MSKAYTVGRGSTADIKIPRQHDAVGKLHLEIQDLGDGEALIADLRSTNGTFVKAGRSWEEITKPRIVVLDAELMLGNFRTTPRKLLAAAPLPAMENEKRDASRKEPKSPPAKKRSGPRRNEFGEIVLE